VKCNNIDFAIEESVRVFLEKRLNCYVYVKNNEGILEELLLKRGFMLIDTMQVLMSPHININNIKYENNKIVVIRIGMDLIPLWIDIFCNSFDALDWKDEVEKIVNSHYKDLVLLLSYTDDNTSKIPIGCAALYHRHGIIGLYCLGTIESFRGKGSAKQIIKISMEIARNEGFSFLFLQAFTNEQFIDFYKKMGFQMLYKKKIYTLSK